MRNLSNATLWIVIFLVAVVLRASGFNNERPIPPIGTTPGALHRTADTIFLCGIGIALVEIHRVLKRKSDSGSEK